MSSSRTCTRCGLYRPYRIHSLVNTISSLISFIFRFEGSSFELSKLMSFRGLHICFLILILMSSSASFHLYLLFVFIVALALIHQTTPELLPQLEVTLRPRRIPIAGLFTILWYYPGFILPGAPYYSAPASYYTGTLTHCRVIGNTIQRNSIDSSQIGADSFHGLG